MSVLSWQLKCILVTWQWFSQNSSGSHTSWKTRRRPTKATWDLENSRNSWYEQRRAKQEAYEGIFGGIPWHTLCIYTESEHPIKNFYLKNIHGASKSRSLPGHQQIPARHWACRSRGIEEESRRALVMSTFCQARATKFWITQLDGLSKTKTA